MIKTMKLIAVGFVMIFVTSLHGENCDSCTHITFSTDYLYWNTRKCDLDYAIPEDATFSINSGEIYRVCPEYNSGFRVGARASSCDKDFGARYTHYCQDRFDSITSLTANLAATRIGNDGNQRATMNGNIDFASGKYDIDLNVVDIEAGRTWNDGCGSSARLFGGGKLAYINQTLDIFYAEDVNDKEGNIFDIDSVHRKNDMDAYGLYLGGEGIWKFWCDLGLFGRTSIGALLGNFDREYAHTRRLGGNDLQTRVRLHDDCCRVVGELEIAAGLNYDLCHFACADWSLQIGYEYHQWWNTSDFIDVLSTSSGSQHVLDHHIDSLGFDGFFARLGLTF